MKAVHLDGESLVTGVATTVIDASPEDAASDLYQSLYSRAFQRSAKSYGILDLEVKHTNPHSLYYLTTRDLGVPGLAPREFRTRVIWTRIKEGRIFLNIVSTQDLDKEIALKKTSVIGNTISTWCFDPVEDLHGIPQTTVTFTSHVDIKIAVPSIVMNRLTRNFGGQLSDLRKKLDRSLEVDTIKRNNFVEKIKRATHKVTEEEVDKFKKKMKDVPGAKLFGDSIAQTWIKVERGGKGWGKSQITVKASVEEVAAFFWQVDSRTTVFTKDVTEFEKIVWAKEKIESRYNAMERFYTYRMKMLRTGKGTIFIFREPAKGESNTLLSKNSNASGKFDKNI
jgi:hypothetical protein